MPNRILRESICTSDTINKLTWFEEILYYRLIVNCDDFGRFDGRAVVVKNMLFPLKENLDLKTVESALQELEKAGLIALYTFEGKRFLCLPTWKKYQTPRAKVSKYPDPQFIGNGLDSTCKQMQADENICKQMQADENICKQMQADENICNQVQSDDSKCTPYSRIEFENRIRESINEKCVTDNDSRTARFTPPSVDEVKAYCVERKNGVDAERFVDFYTSKGWMVGKTKMKDWKSAVRTWEKRDNNGTNGNAGGTPEKTRNWNLDAIVL